MNGDEAPKPRYNPVSRGHSSPDRGIELDDMG
jgi:hypothetical protein